MVLAPLLMRYSGVHVVVINTPAAVRKESISVTDTGVWSLKTRVVPTPITNATRLAIKMREHDPVPSGSLKTDLAKLKFKLNMVFLVVAVTEDQVGSCP